MAAPASQLLRELAASPQQSVSVAAAMATVGWSRAHGLALILFALPETIPLPLPSLSAVLGIPLVVVAAHLTVFGEGSMLPQRALQVRMPRRLLVLLARYVAPVLAALELVARPRLAVVLRHERWLGAVCLYLAVLLLLPLPFVNLAPALSLVAIALGMIQRDGLLVVVGLVATIVTTLSVGLAAQWLGRLIESF